MRRAIIRTLDRIVAFATLESYGVVDSREPNAHVTGKSPSGRAVLAILVCCALGASLLIFSSVASASRYSGSTTAYHYCDGSTRLQADGTLAQVGEAANNFLPLGTWIKVTKPKRVFGRSYFKISDRGGPGFALDFWAPSCGSMHNWGRRNVTFWVVPRKFFYAGRPRGGWDFSGRKPRWKG